MYLTNNDGKVIRVGQAVEILWDKTGYITSENFSSYGNITSYFVSGDCLTYHVENFNVDKPEQVLLFKEEHIVILEEDEKSDAQETKFRLGETVGIIWDDTNFIGTSFYLRKGTIIQIFDNEFGETRYVLNGFNPNAEAYSLTFEEGELYRELDTSTEEVDEMDEPIAHEDEKFDEVVEDTSDGYYEELLIENRELKISLKEAIKIMGIISKNL